MYVKQKGPILGQNPVNDSGFSRPRSRLICSTDARSGADRPIRGRRTVTRVGGPGTVRERRPRPDRTVKRRPTAGISRRRQPPTFYRVGVASEGRNIFRAKNTHPFMLFVGQRAARGHHRCSHGQRRPLTPMTSSGILGPIFSLSDLHARQFFVQRMNMSEIRRQNVTVIEIDYKTTWFC